MTDPFACKVYLKPDPGWITPEDIARAEKLASEMLSEHGIPLRDLIAFREDHKHDSLTKKLIDKHFDDPKYRAYKAACDVVGNVFREFVPEGWYGAYGYGITLPESEENNGSSKPYEQ